ncbi:MAG: beta-ketoacyl-ACP synthase [Pikeienuella sp.]
MAEGRSGLSAGGYPGLPFDCPVGRMEGVETAAFPAELGDYDNRANRLAWIAGAGDGFAERVAEARARWGAGRIGVVMGTSTSGIDKLEEVYRARGEGDPIPPDYSMRHHDNHHAVAGFLRFWLGLSGPAHTVSTACSSSAKALVDAVQMVELGLCDAVLTGGVDSLCLTSLNGFEALQLISRQPCRPCDETRDGVTIGEAAALMLVERDATEGVRVAGYGESSDGAHMSTPPADGAGAAAAMRAALASAGLAPGDIDYVNMHGTATPLNDASESAAIVAALGRDVPVASLKGAVGHTLGAAGALEIVLCAIALEEGLAPGTVGMSRADPALECNMLGAPRAADLTHVMSNAFGFGGSNCSVVLSR